MGTTLVMEQSVITDTMICAEGIDTDSCQGDSGGPLIVAGTREQVGVTSWGIGCNSGLPGVYVNLMRFTQWIDEEIASVEFTTTTTTTDSGDVDSEEEGDGVARLQMWLTVTVVVASALAVAA